MSETTKYSDENESRGIFGLKNTWYHNINGHGCLSSVRLLMCIKIC